MPRYFLEVAYRGTRYSGFQVQENAETVQSEVERALALVQREPVALTGSSRTDAGVHALQNYFHFDLVAALHPQLQYKLNAILPKDLVVKGIYPVGDEAHARFHAISRAYEYRIHRYKDPFLEGLSLYYPYPLDLSLLQKTAEIIKMEQDFFPFAKTNTQVTSFRCTIYESKWEEREGEFVYYITGNRFLRGMVRLLTASQLKVGRGKLALEEFKSLFGSGRKCGFSVPPVGLFLKEVQYPEKFLSSRGAGLAGF